MNRMKFAGIILLFTAIFALVGGVAATRHESFDREPPNWEGLNNRTTNFPSRAVNQNFGYSRTTSHAGGNPGEIGGTINPAAEPAYYGLRLKTAADFEHSITVSGKMFVAPGPNHCLLGFFNPATLNGWRTPNTMVLRINGRNGGFHCHLEYCTSRWRAGAGVVGEMEPGKKITPKLMPAGQVYEWSMTYDPNGASAGTGLLTCRLGAQTATCPIHPDHRNDGATFTHFGIVPVMKAWDNPGEIWIDDIKIQSDKFDFAADPNWDGLNNRTNYLTSNTRPRFDFGWSPTHFAAGKSAGEFGGLIFRGDCRDAKRMAAYGDKLAVLNLSRPLVARGKVTMLRGVTDSTASIGFYNSASSLRVSHAQDHSIPMDYLGINIEGPSSEGFFFYPVYRNHGGIAASGAKGAPKIYPDRQPHDWRLQYDPDGAGGNGLITVSLDGKSCTLALDPGVKQAGASFDRFGICTPWIDGNSVTAYFDDLEYTFEQ
jgi:hypothetical protein